MNMTRNMVLYLGLLTALSFSSAWASSNGFQNWLDTMTDMTKDQPATSISPVELILISQDYGSLEINRSVHTKTQLKIGAKTYTRGLGTHSNARLQIMLHQPVKRFYAEVGIDNNHDTAGKGSVRFIVKTSENILAETGICRGREPAVLLDINLKGLQQFDILINAADDGISYDQSNIANAYIELGDGRKIYLDKVSREGVRPQLLSNVVLPFAFDYDGQSSDQLLPHWQRSIEIENAHQGQKRIVTWQQQPEGLEVQWTLQLFNDRPACELNLAFAYHSTQPAGILTNVRVVRHLIETAPIEVVAAHGGTASFAGEPHQSMPLDFKPIIKTITKPSDTLCLGVSGGWSSNGNLPIWLFTQPNGEGLYYALGWTGQWKATFKGTELQSCSIEAGMEYLNLRLRNGERIRQPSVLLGHFAGGRRAGHNALRNTLYEKYTALLDGQKPLPPVSWNHWFGYGNNNVNEEKMMQAIEMCAPMGIDYVCLDAGWYNVDFWQAGDWRPNPNKFPNGLEPVAQAIKKKGMVMGLWFDPERVTDEAYDAFEHKEWLVPASKKPALEGKEVFVWFVDLTIPAARQWVIDLITDYYRRLDLRWIRYDLNYPPLEMWRNAHENEPDRLGMKEIRYIEGLYQVLDGLNKNCPDMIIEWCSGGGRRIDLETIRRSQTFWKSDVTGDGNITRAHLTGGNQFLPGNYLNSNLIHLESSYDYLCQFAGPLGFGHDFKNDSPEQKELGIKMIKLYKSIRHLIVKDFYPLFNDYPQDHKQWDGWQFHDPDNDEGFFVLLRPENSPYNGATIKLHGLNNRIYKLLPNQSCGLPSSATGRQLIEGIAVAIPSQRDALLVRYH